MAGLCYKDNVGLCCKTKQARQVALLATTKGPIDPYSPTTLRVAHCNVVGLCGLCGLCDSIIVMPVLLDQCDAGTVT